MMDISNLTDQEKSVLLAKVMGWEIETLPNYVDIFAPPDRWVKDANLYHPANMALAFQCHFWAIYYAPSVELRSKYCQWFDLNTIWMEEKLQSLILDSVLYIAIEAGLDDGWKETEDYHRDDILGIN